ncbi:MAG: FAD binding domain-containing protein [Bryobacteraceae bacterium]|nr:FAD binding domain-containing protein [Bryobacteraceae bacterium]
MNALEYANPTTLKDAVALLGPSWNDAAVLAGGTDLISMMKDLLVSPRRLVNIKNIAELGGIARKGGALRIGAAATFDDLASSAAVRAEFPALTEAVLGVTSPQIRNMGTAGGDLCQRPRCWFYRTGNGLLAIKDGKSLVPEGDNRYHAIFGGGPAYFVSASSLGPALVALNAKLRLVSAAGERTVEAARFFVSPQTPEQREVDLRPGEILADITVPLVKTRNFTYEVRQKEALDWPLTAASVALTMDGSRVKSAKIVLGHVAPTPWSAAKAEAFLTGKSIDETTAAAAGDAAADGAQPLSGNAYKVQLVKVAVKRALLAAARA